ncbi:MULTISPECIES: NADH-quinone oxidoreductase subunit N [Thermus]|uniref:NADH-quinone oxidoreductase subunit N n=1 Tax=Thermus scotoductus (strain ATCC 700910 / SA-01) TaxID=743525 RepID=E8PM69_THESS|nr:MULTISPECIES: NADH-quinone oxidoreductase subunit N [Thermus]ADW21224.1 NADH-quinone oxidoreductase, subunit N [Thermus scotoductus SA-01]
MILLVLSSFAVALTLVGFFVSVPLFKRLTILGLSLALLSLLFTWGKPFAFGPYQVDGISQVFTLLALLGALWTVGLVRTRRFEFYLLVLYATLGMHLLASTKNLILMLVALEALSLPLYALATWRRGEGLEAALKYFLLGALAAAFFLYGTALHYGATGSLLAGTPGEGPLYALALGLLLVGLGFKVALAPFHFWTPDVYQGSPTPVVLFMATGVKAAAFAALLRVVGPGALDALALLIALSVLLGNLAALGQKEAKRLLAYSSIAHAGYMALALYTGNLQALGFYLLTYVLATGLAFAVLSEISPDRVPLERVKGLFHQDPLLGLGLFVSSLSLLGLPPLAGFWGKYLVFSEAAKAGAWGLLVLALVTSAVSAYYYLALGLAVFQKGAAEAHPRPLARSVALGVALLLILLGLIPGAVLPALAAG